MCINCLRLSLSGLVEVILCVCCRQSTGRAKKVTHPLEKIDISGTVVNFYSKLSAYRGGFIPNILQISLQYFLAFQNYNYLNLNVHFSK